MAHTFAGISTHGPYAGIGITGRISRRRPVSDSTYVLIFAWIAGAVILAWLALTLPVTAPVLFFRARKAAKNALSPEAYAAQLAIYDAHRARLVSR